MAVVVDVLGTDIQALDDYADPEILVTGTVNLAYALGRRCITPSGALEEIGETQSYDSFDLRDWLGRMGDANAMADLQALANQVLTQDPRVQTVTAIPTLAAGLLSLSVSGQSAAGPFAFVVKANAVTVQIIFGGS